MADYDPPTDPPTDPQPEPQPEPCPGQCNRTWRKLERRTNQARERAQAAGTPLSELPINREPARHADVGVWCTSCAGQIVAAVSALVPLMEALRRLPLGKIAAQRTEKVGKTPKMVAPPSLSPAYDLADELGAWLIGASLEVSAHLEPALAGSGEHFLLTWRRVLFSEALRPTCQRGIQLAERALAAAGLDDVVHRLHAPCPTCNRKALSRRDGAKVVRCGACNREWAEDHYRRLAITLADSLPKPKAPRRRSGRLVAAQYESPQNSAGRDTGQLAAPPVPTEAYRSTHATPRGPRTSEGHE